MAQRGDRIPIEIDGRIVELSSPDRVYFPERGETKLDLARYYLAVGDGIVRALHDRPTMLHRFPKGVDGPKVHQKRLPAGAPPWVETCEIYFPRYGRTADELCVTSAADVIWAVQMSTVEFHPWNSRRFDVEKPDEWRIDLDPMPGVEWAQIVSVAGIVREVLVDHGLTAWPKTSGSRGFHIYTRIAPRWPYPKVRLAAEAVAREVQRRAPELATSRWWKEERGARVFVDFNQNAKDRTVASTYSVRALPDARVSTPLHWDEVPDCRPELFTVDTVPARYAEIGDPWADIDATTSGLDGLLQLADDLGPAEKAPKADKAPLIEIARTRTREEAMAALDTWRAAHPDVSTVLTPTDVLVDGMRGPSSIWYRIRINLQHVPEDQRPAQGELLADYSPWEGYSGNQWRRG